MLYAFAFVMGDESISGPVNLVSPEPISQVWFASTVTRMLRSPPGLACALSRDQDDRRIEREMLLAGPPVLSRKLLDAGHRF